MNGSAASPLTEGDSPQPPVPAEIAGRSFPYSILFAIVFFVLLWLLDFPKPSCDDLFYIGAGLHVAEGGDLSNGFLARQQFPQHLFYIYPPVHSYGLAGWLKIFGVNTGAMTAFQGLMYIVIALSSIVILRRQQAPTWLEWAVTFAVATAFVPLGLRPETFGSALIMLGFVVVQTVGAKSFWLVPGYFLLSLGLATAPRITFFGLGFILIAVYDTYKTPQVKRHDLRTHAVLALVGMVLAVLLFLTLIDFHPGAFWKAFHHYSQIVGGDPAGMVVRYFKRYVGVAQWPVFPLWLVSLLMSWRAPASPLKRMGFMLAAALLPLALVGGLGNATLWFILLGMLAAAALVLKMPGRQSAKWAIVVSTVAVLMLANLKMFINIVGIVSGNIPTRAVTKVEALQLRSTPEHPLLLDCDVARYVFDYRIPEHSLDWGFAAPFPASMGAQTELRPDDVCLLGPAYVDVLIGLHLVQRPPPPVWGGWLRRWALYRYPREATIIPVSEMIRYRGSNAITAAPAGHP